MSAQAHRPHRIVSNKVPVYYAGGERIDRFRGERSGEQQGPEDWVASVTAFPAHLLPPDRDPETGVSRLPDGTSLRAAVQEDPEGWLGPDLAATYGHPALLVKLLDAGERLPVHCHPSREFAQAKLDSPFGKNEGWIVLETDNPEMWLGFRRDVSHAELRRWIEDQNVDAMLDAMNRLDVHAGDVLYVPAGTPHAFGPGVLIVELQEPTSFSILAEYRAFGLTPEQATLGLSWDDALSCFDLKAYDKDRMRRLRLQPRVVSEDESGQIWSLFPTEGDAYFRAYRARSRDVLALHALAGFMILVVVEGEGKLTSPGGENSIRHGETWVVPHATGPLHLHGQMEVIACLPPRLHR